MGCKYRTTQEKGFVVVRALPRLGWRNGRRYGLKSPIRVSLRFGLTSFDRPFCAGFAAAYAIVASGDREFAGLRTVLRPTRKQSTNGARPLVAQASLGPLFASG